MDARETGSAPRITVDRDRCIGAGQCVLAAPEVFTQDDDGLVDLLPGHEDAAGDAHVRDVPMACPVQAVTISDG
ncbi:ferredoxin [Streptomyces morookaense]|uniref:Ferredoxin n=1 Tax=Streptomyces morookaense TaxID=1970 RepID=A0A7Y7BAW0_STRMO|nr:ferredoxin [Streptomyces morookaense]NVK82174.1 ferredoxin [Streptomyces morookaense]GHF46412.1 ferredoxin [Streptomyces morookaense]